MDLGHIIGGLAETYIGAKFAPQGGGVGYAPVGYSPQAVTAQSALWPFEEDDPLALPTFLRKKKRRRRRRLATLSDIRDLAALTAVLGKGQARTTWIATHPS